MGSSQMKEKGVKGILALVVLTISVLGGALISAEPQHADAPIKVPEQIMMTPYVAHSSPAVFFQTEARLFNYLGVEYIPAPVLRLEYVCPFCGEDLATEGQLLNHMSINHG